MLVESKSITFNAWKISDLIGMGKSSIPPIIRRYINSHRVVIHRHTKEVALYIGKTWVRLDSNCYLSEFNNRLYPMEEELFKIFTKETK